MKVYLYELDSVRNTAAEIELAQNRLFEETIVKRNTVVLSSNQLLDGMGVTGILCGEEGEKNYQALLQLFQLGLVKVCKFTDPTTGQTVESLGEYWCQNKMREQFVHSGIDLGQNDEVREKIEKALFTQNLSLVWQWASGKRGKEKEKAEYVYYIAKLIYELGKVEYDIWVEEETTKKTKVDFNGLLELFLREAHSGISDNVQKALDVLNLASREITDSDQRQYRSNWYKELKIEGNGELNVPAVAHIAKYIIDLCYDISVESGISGVNLPYMVDKNGKAKEGTNVDEIRRWQCDYIIEKLEEHLDVTVSALRFPPWRIAVTQMEALGIASADDSGQRTRNLNKMVAVTIVQDIIFLGIWLALTAVLNDVIYPYIDSFLNPIIVVTSCIRYIYFILSTVVSAWATAKLEKFVLHLINDIWPHIYIKEFGAQILDSIFKLLYRQAQINSYLKRAKLYPRHHKKNRKKKA